MSRDIAFEAKWLYIVSNETVIFVSRAEYIDRMTKLFLTIYRAILRPDDGSCFGNMNLHYFKDELTRSA